MAQPAPKPHRFTRAVPPLHGWEFDFLKESIAKFGQKDPILLYEGEILDGIHRDKACRELKIEPWYKPFQGNEEEAIALVQARLCVRNTTASQRALVAADLANAKRGGNRAGESARVQIRSEVTQDEAAKKAGVGTRSVAKAAKVLKEGTPELVEAVREGKVTVSDAAKVADKPPEAQKAAVEAKVNGHARTASAAADDGPPPGPAKRLPWEEPSRNGKPDFDDRKIDDALGKLIRLLDERAKAVGGGKLHQACMDACSKAAEAWEAWQKARG